MTVELRPRTAVLVLLAVLVVGATGSVGVAEIAGGESDAMVHYAPIDGDDRHLWLYTSRGPTFEESTLAMNVIVYGNPDDVRHLLLEEGRGDWNETVDQERDVAPDEPVGPSAGSEIEWDTADGSERYAYLAGRTGGLWLSESFQIHDGEYLGSRHHVRAYTSPDGEGEWIAMQAHHEYWDWFTVRHVVTSVEQSQSHLEREFANVRGAPDIRRIPTDDAEGGGFDRWVTIVDFGDPGSVAAFVLPLVLLGAVGSRVRGTAAAVGVENPESDARALIVSLGIVVLVMSVRLAGVGLERSLDVPPKSIAILLYPAVFAGLPAATALLARSLDGPRAFGSASLGFLAAVLVDYTYLGVTHVVLNTLVHRGALAVALGLIAVGSTRTGTQSQGRMNPVRFGVILWLVATVLPLLRHTPLPV